MVFVSNPIPSMYGIFAYIWLIFMGNVDKYTIHGCYGNLMEFETEIGNLFGSKRCYKMIHDEIS